MGHFLVVFPYEQTNTIYNTFNLRRAVFHYNSLHIALLAGLQG